MDSKNYYPKIKELFDSLDKNKDGKIQFKELKEALSTNDAITKSLIDRMGGDELDFRQFLEYIWTIDKKIELDFSRIDTNKDGRIDADEIKIAFANMNIFLNEFEINKLINKIDKDKSLKIDREEWKNFFRFAPHDQLEQLLQYWRTEAFVNEQPPLPADFTKKEIESGLWWRNLLAGASGGVVSRTCTAPLDRVKVFMQVNSGQKMSIINSIRGMIKEGGIRSLWRGNGISVIKIAPESAIKFMAYEQIKALMGKDGQPLPPFQKLLSGSLAGFIAQSTIYPLEVLKTRLALRKTGQYSSMSDCVGKIYRQEGMRAFYKGYLVNAVGILPAAGVDLALYETLKQKYKEFYPNNPQPGALALILIANTSATAAMFSSYPLFLIRTRLQSSTDKSVSLGKMIVKIWKQDGFFGFFRGSLPNLAKVAPAASIGYVTYEHVSKYLGLKR